MEFPLLHALPRAFSMASLRGNLLQPPEEAAGRGPRGWIFPSPLLFFPCFPHFPAAGERHGPPGTEVLMLLSLSLMENRAGERRKERKKHFFEGKTHTSTPSLPAPEHREMPGMDSMELQGWKGRAEHGKRAQPQPPLPNSREERSPLNSWEPRKEPGMGTGLLCRGKTRRKVGKEAVGKGQLFPQGWESGKGSGTAAVPMKGTFFHLWSTCSTSRVFSWSRISKAPELWSQQCPKNAHSVLRMSQSCS